MAGSYGAESTRGEWYRLSFTVGGLLASQGRALAKCIWTMWVAVTLGVLPKPRWANPLL